MLTFLANQYRILDQNRSGIRSGNVWKDNEMTDYFVDILMYIAYEKYKVS